MKKITFLFLAFLFSEILFSQYVVTLQPDAIQGKDTYVRSHLPNNNYGDDGSIRAIVWTDSGNDFSEKAMLEFDLSSIPQDVINVVASLSLYYNPDTWIGQGQFGSNTAILKRITTTWSESTVTWNTMPLTVDDNQVYIDESVVDNQDYENIDVSALVVDMLNNPTESYGFMHSLMTNVSYASMIFASSDYSNSSLHPKLVIQYEILSNDELAEESISIYPIPCNDKLFIQTNRTLTNIEIYSIDGKHLDIKYFDGKLDISKLTPGTYFLIMNSGNQILTRKIVKF